ncbi:DUF6644 family protein [Massilia sp. Leaf139]|uniref:DUF6644 family protein n=1 Tax=Massilia sp. Leaf139 TaxID=1736272 RepID=UPI0006FF66C6|nr:DUF6644 family protein [Massilia sp. Leaf139]KQQ88441.1 hypothetical protein ASF77_12290 [Massilia sp. Leaf139]
MAAAAGVLQALAATPLSSAMREGAWLYPIVEIVHIAGFAVLVGSVVLFDLRVLGFARNLPVVALGNHLLRWALASLLLVVPAGLLLFSAHSVELANNPAFILKLVLIVIAGLNALAFHLLPYRSVASWDRDRPAPPLARAGAGLSILLWLGVISCGRMLAYL